MSVSEPVLRLKKGREKSLLRRHPWIFSGAVDRLTGQVEPGGTIRVESAAGEFLARGAYSPRSQICARVWSWDVNETIDADFFQRLIDRAVGSRSMTLCSSQDAGARLVHAESDGLPGLVVDRYGEWLVVQLLSCGAERWKKEVMSSLSELENVRGIYERSDVDVRLLEGLEERTGVQWGDAPPDLLEIVENGIKFRIDIYKGHKTGFYLDQRENRRIVRDLAAGKEALDCFCYTGGFSANLLAGGAKSVVGVDSSAEALRLARENLQLNGLSMQRYEQAQGDVFQTLRTYRDSRRQFDLIVLDPPKFAPTISQAERAARGYKDINLLALKLLRPGGLLATFSCSGGVDMALFQKIVAGAALDAGVTAQIIQRLHQAPDHPIGLNFPEGEYLKGLVVQKAM